jgi:drug/metabolite transporter (DMT)-like permease
VSSIRSARRAPLWLSVLLGVIGVLLIVIAVLYFVEPAHQLPSFFPGHTVHGNRPRTKHGIAALVVGLVVLAGAWLSSGRRRI